MNKLQIFLMLRRNLKLSASRSVMYETNNLAKILIMISLLAAVVYLLFISIGMSLAANTIGTFTAPQFFFSLLPFFLVVDFVLRMFLQRTPAQVVKPYLLLPLRKYDCIDSFMLASVFSARNFIWLFITTPFVIMSVVFQYGVFVSLSLVLIYQMLVVASSLFYMLCRTLIIYRWYYFLLPISVFALLFSPFVFVGIDDGMSFYSEIGTLVVDSSLIAYFALSLLLLALFLVNRRVQFKHMQLETSSTDNIKVRSLSCLSLLDCQGVMGEYMKIEVKSLLHNKSIRQTFIFQLVFVVILSLVNSFTDIYEDGFSTRFWAVYPFELLCINLVKIMGVEGNYIECLMVRKQKIRDLLEAKYRFYAILQFLPLFLMLPTVIYGKYSFLMLFSLMLFTMGPMFFLLMQLAVVNKQTLPLNSKLTKRSGLETNYIELLLEMIVMFLPILLLYVLPFILGDTFSYIILLVVGVAFVATHKMWINDIYRRMMKRKYQNLYGFMTSR